MPNLETSRRILSTLLSKDSVKGYLYRVLSKYKWDPARLLTDPKVMNVLSMYIARVIVSNLAGSGVMHLLSLSRTSTLIVALTASRLGLPVGLTYYDKEALMLDTLVGTLRRGDYVAMVSDMLTYDYLVKVIELISKYELTLKLIISVILADKELEKEFNRLAVLEYLIP